MESKKWDNLYWIFFCLYLISFCMPVIHLHLYGSGAVLGFHAAYFGLFFFYGLAWSAHISAIGGLIHRQCMKHPENPNYNWTKVSILLAVIGTISWSFIFYTSNEPLLIGYYVWAVATCGMAISYYFFRKEKSKETRKEGGEEEEVVE